MKTVNIIKTSALIIFMMSFHLSYGQWTSALPSNIDGTFDNLNSNVLNDYGWTSDQNNIIYSLPNPVSNNPYIITNIPILEDSNSDNRFIILQNIQSAQIESNSILLEVGYQYRLSLNWLNTTKRITSSNSQDKIFGKWRVFLVDQETNNSFEIESTDCLFPGGNGNWQNYSYMFTSSFSNLKLIFRPQMGIYDCNGIYTEPDYINYSMAIDNIKLEYLPVDMPQICNDCSSFNLAKGEKYLVSGWVKLMEENSTIDGISYSSVQTFTYENTFLGVSYLDASENLIDGSEIKFYPSGEIIDGWQKVEGTITIPSAIDHFKISLVNENSNYAAFFDDIRVHPYNGNLKSFVYDQASQKLMAELDENNYATFYEYDKEGGLIRVKKETERGVYTIQETRSSTKKTGIDGN